MLAIYYILALARNLVLIETVGMYVEVKTAKPTHQLFIMKKVHTKIINRNIYFEWTVNQIYCLPNVAVCSKLNSEIQNVRYTVN